MKFSSWLVALKSWLLGLVDYSYILLNLYKGPHRPKYFRLGWGRLDSYHKVLKESTEGFERKQLLCNINLQNEIKWDDECEVDADVVIRRGRFRSPLSDSLPEESRYCDMVFVSPVRNDDFTENVTCNSVVDTLINESDNASNCRKNESLKKSMPIRDRNVVVLMLPATGEECFTKRIEMARSLAREYNWSSLAIVPPYYGTRRPAGQEVDCVQTVAEYMTMNIGVIQEAALLVRYLQEHYDAECVCVTGYSWGAAMSACTCVTASQLGADYRKIACAPYAGSSTSAVMADGLLEDNINWSSLHPASGRKNEYIENKESILHIDTKNKLHATLFEMQLSILTKKASGPSVAAVRGASFGHDKFIKPPLTEAFFSDLESMCFDPNRVVCEWLPGGHVWAMLMRSSYQTNAIVGAVTDTLESQRNLTKYHSQR